MWTRPRTMKTFGTTSEFANSTKALAANQGLYNGFLAAGLIWGLLYPDSSVGLHIQISSGLCNYCCSLRWCNFVKIHHYQARFARNYSAFACFVPIKHSETSIIYDLSALIW